LKDFPYGVFQPYEDRTTDDGMTNVQLFEMRNHMQEREILAIQPMPGIDPKPHLMRPPRR
jgi:hypothetical protein